MIQLANGLLLGLGIVCGLLLSLILVMLWVAVAGPIQEWLYERLVDPLHDRSPLPVDESGPFAVLISDVHLDTWTYSADSTQPLEPKCLSFLRFLEWVEKEPQITKLYINGDIMDLPPHPLNQPVVPILRITAGNPDIYPDLEETPGLGVLNPSYDPVILKIGSFSKPITYQTGNHDLGLYGLKYIRPTLTWDSFKVAWNPSMLLQLRPDRRLYIEHGHRHDPFLWIYLRYSIMELLQGPEAIEDAQRGGKVGMTNKAGDRSLLPAARSSNLNFEGTGDVEPPAGEGFFPRLARYRFRQAARRLFRQIKDDAGHKIEVLTMGHTHLPDRYWFPGKRLYINSGDWAGNDDHRCFVKVYANGVVTGPHQWNG